MNKISKELCERFHLGDIEDFCKRHPEIDFYRTFLIQSDYIAFKIAEAAYLGEEAGDYTDIIEARKFCRRKINELGE